MAPPDDLPPGSAPDRAWAAPEAPVEGPTPTLPASPVADTTARPEGRLEVPVPLRPMTVADLLDGGFAILKVQPRTVLALAALVVVPLQLVVAFLSRDQLGDVEELFRQVYSNPGLAEQQLPVGSTVASLVAVIGGGLALSLIAAGLARMVTAWYSAHAPGIREVLRAVLRVTPALVVAWVLIHVLELVGAFLLGFPALVVMTWFLVTTPAIAVEGLGPIAGMRRAARLANRRFWPLMGIGVVSGIVSSVLAAVLSLVPQLLAVVVGSDYSWILLGVGSIVSGLVAQSFIAGVAVLVYLDLRIRTEGLDLAWAAERHLPQ